MGERTVDMLGVRSVQVCVSESYRHRSPTAPVVCAWGGALVCCAHIYG
jgi:hypothetical protein